MRRMTLPTEALLLRRMEGLLFQIATPAARRGELGRALHRARLVAGCRAGLRAAR